jgi:hypothetical protein
VTFTGSATTHANAQDVSNIGIEWEDAAFTVGNAGLVTNATKTDFSLDFDDPAGVSVGTLTTNTGTLAEAVTNNGSIASTATLSLANDTFATAGALTSGTHYIVLGVPAGLTASVVVTSTSSAQLSFTGAATNNTSTADATVSVIFLSSAFTLGVAATGSTPLSMALNF